MAIGTPTQLTAASDTVDRTSYTTASITPASGKLYLLAVYNRVSAGTANTPTVTGAGVTWVKIDDIAPISALRHMTVFRAIGPGSAGALTISLAGQTQMHCIWSISEWDGIDMSGTNGSGAIVQSNTGSATATSLSVSLSAFGDTANATYGMFFHAAAEATTVGSGFTSLSDTQVADGGANGDMKVEYKLSNDTGVDVSFTTSSQVGGIAVEIKAAVVATGNGLPLVNAGLVNMGLVNGGLAA